MGAVYLDTSAVLRALLEPGMTPAIEKEFREADTLVTSRLTQVEVARAFHRLRLTGECTETRLADLHRDLDALWPRCHIFELTETICSLASVVAPSRALRALDALHLATFLIARRHLGGLSLLTADQRLRQAAGLDV